MLFWSIKKRDPLHGFVGASNSAKKLLSAQDPDHFVEVDEEVSLYSFDNTRKLVLAESEATWVQDINSFSSIYDVDFVPEKKVWDVCAGAGGKSLILKLKKLRIVCLRHTPEYAKGVYQKGR